MPLKVGLIVVLIAAVEASIAYPENPSSSNLGRLNEEKLCEVFQNRKGCTRPLSCPCSSAGSTCWCVPFYQCRNGIIHGKGEGVISARGFERPSNSTAGNRSVLTSDPICSNQNSMYKCCELKEQPFLLRNPDREMTVSDTRGECGVRQREGNATLPVFHSRIGRVIGNYSSFGEFPWMLAIIPKANLSLKFGGVLISPSVVLTVAHRLNSLTASDLTVRAGEWDFKSEIEPYNHQDRGVKKITIHPKFDKSELFYNVALLMLNEPMPSNRHIASACLPQATDNFENKHCIVTGWGQDAATAANADGPLSDVLKAVNLEVLPHHECDAKLKRTPLGMAYQLHGSFICAGGEEKKDACEGDGGSPLVCPTNESGSRYAVVGLVSWGIGCGIKDRPGVYTNVPFLRDWINEELKKF
ncbi:phenoloxidase-activating factor 2-like [Thrips palmi]|uniref:Phenoloxidase-activating factor 2 n=1 Tax=Thrips palmi TaxID=161013 RepID=A0A6P8YFN9_THRPL|nr:phenoloxidase-activating factor 2-like [Thrips palmi]